MQDEDDVEEVDEGPVAGPSASSFNRNPQGKNRYLACPSASDPQLQNLLREYHRRGIADGNKLNKLLRAEHSIQISASSIKRARSKMGLKGSRSTTRETPEVVKRQLVVDQMAKDPLKRRGPRQVTEDITRETGVRLTRSFVEMEMRLQEPEGFASRSPTSKQIHRVALVVLGPHYEWSGDGHDKLTAIGFPIWGIRDVWSGKWLGLWVVPSNRVKLAIAYLYLSLVEELGGMPIQSTTDCGSETVQVYGFASALREAFSPELPVTELPAHQFLPSIRNTTIERGWLSLRLRWGDNIKIYWNKGVDIYGYDSGDPEQLYVSNMSTMKYSKRYESELVQWLWPTLIRAELDTLKDKFNNHVVRTDKKKKNPSGVSPNVAMALPEEYGAQNCLQMVDREVVRKIMEELGGEDIIRFVSVEYEQRAKAVFDSLNTTLTLDNVWHVFKAMMPIMYPG